jgi:hypothetical protein
MFPCPFHPYLIKLRHTQFIDMAVNYLSTATKKLKLSMEINRGVPRSLLSESVPYIYIIYIQFVLSRL